MHDLSSLSRIRTLGAQCTCWVARLVLSRASTTFCLQACTALKCVGLFGASVGLTVVQEAEQVVELLQGWLFKSSFIPAVIVFLGKTQTEFVFQWIVIVKWAIVSVCSFHVYVCHSPWVWSLFTHLNKSNKAVFCPWVLLKLSMWIQIFSQKNALPRQRKSGITVLCIRSVTWGSEIYLNVTNLLKKRQTYA